MRGGHGRDPRIRLAIVGLGRRGTQWAAAASRHSRFQLIGAVDPAPEAIERAVGHGLRCWPNVEAAVGAGADAVVVASPSRLHAEHALLATAAGSGVLVEKPLALSVADAARVAAGARAAQRPVLVAMNFRLRPVEGAIRAGLGRVGPPRTSLIHATWMSAPADDRLDPHAATWDVGVHHVDLLVDRAGTMPSAVSARAGAVHRIQLDWPSGATADWMLDHQGAVFHTYQWVEGPGGGVTADGEDVRLVTRTRRPRRVRLPRTNAPEAALLDHLARALSGDDNGGAFSAEAGLGTIAVMEAAVRSLQDDRPVDPRALLAEADLRA